MLFLTVSDEIVPVIYSLSIKERFAHVEGILACGDLPYYYLEFIVSMLDVPCYYIHGNHDSCEETEGGKTICEPQGCISLEDHCEIVNNLLIAGLGGSLRYNQEPGAQFTETEMMFRMWRLAPRLWFNRRKYGRCLDILLTHAPPHGIHNGPDRPHHGFRAFLKLMDYFQPRYLIHGHIHKSYSFSSSTETVYQQTTVLNTAGYRLLEVAVQ